MLVTKSVGNVSNRSMPLTYQDVINQGILDQLATVYRDPTNAKVLLAVMGFPIDSMPAFKDDPLTFWAQVCEQIRDNVLPGGFETLLQAAARHYPDNPVFTRLHTMETRPGRLRYQDIINQGILDQLAAVYRDPTNAKVLLVAVSFPPERIPIFNDPRTFWMRVCELIRDGVLPGGFETLLQAAAQSYPGNPAFAPFVLTPNAHQHRDTDQDRYVNLLVPGAQNPRQVIELTRQLTQQQNLPQESVILRFANAEGVLISLNGWTMEQALELSERLAGQLSTVSQQVRPIVKENRFEDYLISQLFVEGPDQSRFEINDIRISTLVRDVAQGVISTEYEPRALGHDAKGRDRKVVIDRQNPDGSTERLNADSTLHNQDVREGDTLSVTLEYTVGDVTPAYVSYDAQDRDLVIRIALRLKGSGVYIWLDEWDLKTEQTAAKEIQETLDKTNVVIVFYGANGLGAWQELELELVSERVANKQCLLIPVILPGAFLYKAPLSLRRLLGIQIQSEQDLKAATSALVRKIREADRIAEHSEMVKAQLGNDL